MKRLTAAQRYTIVKARFVERMAIAAIARRLGVSPTTVSRVCAWYVACRARKRDLAGIDTGP